MNIFVTVGAQISFDRLVVAVDDWIKGQDSVYAFAQIGEGGHRPENMDWVEFLAPNVFQEKVLAADLLIAHAGMGSIITALQFGKPIVILPRHANKRETRNDHQVATAKRFSQIEGIYAVFCETEIAIALDSLSVDIQPAAISKHASPELIEKIRKFIQE